MQTNGARQFKCVLIGNLNTGKTAYIKRLLLGDFEKRYVATLGVEVHSLNVQVTSDITSTAVQGNANRKIERVTLNVWDCAGDDNFGGLRDGYWIMADMAIIMFDSFQSFSDAINQWTRHLQRINPNIPIVFVWNKFNQDQTEFTPVQLAEQQTLEEACNIFKAKMPSRFHICKVNTKNAENLLNPITSLLREVMNDSSILVSSEIDFK